MAKSKAQAAQRVRPSRASRHVDADRWNRIFLIGGVVAVIAVAVGFIAYGWYDTKIKPLSKTVLTVGETKYSLAHLERRMKLEVKLAPGIKDDSNRVVNFPNEMLAQLEFEGTLLEGADELGITVSDEDVAKEVRRVGNLAEDSDPRLQANAFRDQVRESGLKENEYRLKLQTKLLADATASYFAFLAPKSEPQVKARWMTFDTSATAQQALDRINAGEDFQLIAQELSLDKTPFERDWSPRGSAILPQEAEDFLFAAQAGQLSQVISVANTYYIAQVQEKDDNRALSDDQRIQVGQRNMNTWIGEQNGKLAIERDLTEDDIVKAINDVFA